MFCFEIEVSHHLIYNVAQGMAGLAPDSNFTRCSTTCPSVASLNLALHSPQLGVSSPGPGPAGVSPVGPQAQLSPASQAAQPPLGQAPPAAQPPLGQGPPGAQPPLGQGPPGAQPLPPGALPGPPGSQPGGAPAAAGHRRLAQAAAAGPAKVGPNVTLYTALAKSSNYSSLCCMDYSIPYYTSGFALLSLINTNQWDWRYLFSSGDLMDLFSQISLATRAHHPWMMDASACGWLVANPAATLPCSFANSLPHMRMGPRLLSPEAPLTASLHLC